MKRWFRRLALSGTLCLLAAAVAGAQAPGATFDVASVKPNKSGSTQVKIDVTATTVTLLNLQLRPIIQLAWGINTPSRLAGIPDWANAERFDIIGKAESIGSREAMRPMLQALLAERFKLAAHMETRKQPIYALVKARRDDKLGPALHPSTVTCAGRGATPPADGAPPPVPCGPRPGGAGRLVMVGISMPQLAPMLSLMVGRTAVDRTGLTGLYDFEIAFTPERPLPGPDGAATPAPSNDGPSLFTALQEQLGLKLEPETETVDVLVIDHVERPTEN
jgi:bla regulator protein blaR1